ncbi:lysine decarboxylase-like protein-like protein [Tothia fuscella]|uniref:Lysine decarboxylase-like protein-like protein n=1 Tax=Tothia fuscella TaxID=1048955 RepID=A0A9P4TTK4_9PEZI|nr:lysine decarboxylase-like protein-like protein [Tothia fuscella]
MSEAEVSNGAAIAGANGAVVSPDEKKNRNPVVCVFCGASSGNSPTHLEAARSLAQALHSRNATLVYGGGTMGMMGEIAKTLVSLSGPQSVHGIIPGALVKFEQDGSAIEESIYGKTTVVNDMHTRKHMMAEAVYAGGEGSGFVALSGGYGTLEELMEVTTWNQLGIHGRGVVVYNIEGYWDGLFQWVRTACKAGFIKGENGQIMVEAKSAEEVVRALFEYKNSKERLNLEWVHEG